MRTTRRLLLALALTLVLAPRGLAQEAPAGRWVFEMPRPGVVELEAVALVLELGGGEGAWTVSGTVEGSDGPIEVAPDVLLEPETLEAMWTRQATADGATTDYGLGIGVGDLGGVLTVSHSGGQKKASTFLIVAPDYGAAVALMCNTQGAPLSRLARELLGSVLE